MRLLEPGGEIRLRIAAIGDVGVIGGARARARREGFDGAFAAMTPSFRSADLVFANLEFPVAEPGWVRPGRSGEFWHDRETVEALARAGVGLVSLANNHMMDCGPRGLERTLAACESAGVGTIGAGASLEAACRPAIREVRGLRVVALAYAAAGEDGARERAPGVAPLDPRIVERDLKRWRAEADLLLVSVHWGSMYVDFPPRRVLEVSRLLAREADLILGHHPHVTQGVRRKARRLTLFSLGDACFNRSAGDFEWAAAAHTRRESGVFEILWAHEPGVEYHALTLDEDGIPFMPDPERAEAQAARLRRLSGGLEDADTRFDQECAPRLLRYELDSLGHYLRQGRVDRVIRLLGGVRPRHLRTLWQALRNFRSTA